MRRRQFWSLFGLGLVGVISLIPTVTVMIDRTPIPAGAPPRNALILISLVQAAVLLALAVAVGLRFAPRVGLRSHIAETAAGGAPLWPEVRRDLPIAAVLGAATMAVVVLLDVAFRPYMGDAWHRLEQTLLPGPAVSLLAGLFYGGITEELMVRWGLMSLLAWLIWRIGGGGSGGGAPPRSSVIWVAILVTAILFGVGHLPAVKELTPLNAVIVARTVLLNAIAGATFGWLFWRRSLEAAMIAHATGHLVIFAVRVST